MANNVLPNKKMYACLDGDSVGALVGRAVLSDNEQELHSISAKINHGQDVIRLWTESNNSSVVSAGGDECVLSISPEAIDSIEQLRADYEFATGATLSVGVGSSLSEAGKSLLAAKFRGKNQTVQYDPSVEDDITAAQEHAHSGSGSDEENKQVHAYLPEEEGESADEDGVEIPEDQEEDLSEEISEQPQEDSEPTLKKPLETFMEEKNSDEESESEPKKPLEEFLDNNGLADKREADAQNSKEQDFDDEDLAIGHLPESEDEQPSDSLGTDFGISDGADENSGDESPEGIASEIPGGEEETEEGHPEYQSEEEPTESFDSEDDSETPDLSEVLRGGLEQHSDNMNREKVVEMLASALEAFRSQKNVLEAAKDKAPDFYNANLMMLKCLIEMSKMLGLNEQQDEEQPSEDDSEPTDEEGSEEHPSEVYQEHGEPEQQEAPVPKKASPK